jgi:hypothetical protein
MPMADAELERGGPQAGRAAAGLTTAKHRRRASMPRHHCHHCGSTNLTQTAWRDLLPAVSSIDSIFVYGGAKPIPRTLTFCGSCGEWLVSSLEAQQAEELTKPPPADAGSGLKPLRWQPHATPMIH